MIVPDRVDAGGGPALAPQAAAGPAPVRFLLRCVADGLTQPEPADDPAPLPPMTDADWQTLPALVRHHRLEMMVGAVLDGPSRLGMAVPDPQRRTLRELRNQAVRRTMRLAAEVVRLTCRFAEEGVEVLVLKGVALSVLLHGTPLHRSCRDIDLLVRPGDEARARAILAGCGYGNGADAVVVCLNAVELRNPDLGTVVELHVRLADDERLLPTAALHPFETAVTVDIAGRPVRTLAPDAALVYAAYHGAHHHWFRLHWLADIAAATRSPRIDWRRAAQMARQTGTERHFAMAARLSDGLMGCPPPDPPAPSGRDLAAIRRAESLVSAILAGPPAGDIETVRRVGRLRVLAGELALCRGPGAAWAQLLTRLRPTDTDRAAFPLPAALGALHYPLRILRMAWILCRR